MRVFITLLSLFLCFASPMAAAAGKNTLVKWQGWSDAAFEQAKRENRFILLNMEAVWCHWCHVMDEKTYSDPAVHAYLQENYITLRVDQDARPDLANRYRDYGWPATILFAPDGTEVAKRAGYIAPDNMLRLLKAVVADPSPEAAARITFAKASNNAFLSAASRATLLRKREATYDWDKGGLRTAQKYIDRNSLEYNLVRAASGDAQAEKMARQTLDVALALLDPVWGGVYQYSTGYDWNTPHFEKIMSSQANYLRLYALAYLQFDEPRYKAAAIKIADYLTTFLESPSGASYVSQDADVIPGQHSEGYFALNDTERRKIGIPRIDKHEYARETGWVAEALATLYRATGDNVYLERAIRGANWAIKHRNLGNGGFRHDIKDAFGPYLGDSLAMGRAFLALYHTTAERDWLIRANTTAAFIAKNFKGDNGFVTAKTSGPVAPLPDLEENISTTRWLNLLSHYSGDKTQRALAEHGMRYLASPSFAETRFEESGILLADDELANDPFHLTVVAPKTHARGAALFAYARQQPGWYQRTEWLDRDEGPLPHDDVQYPPFATPAGYACAEQRCSLPAFTTTDYAQRITSYRQQAVK